jgi:hypothetical protein
MYAGGLLAIVAMLVLLAAVTLFSRLLRGTTETSRWLAGLVTTRGRRGNHGDVGRRVCRRRVYLVQETTQDGAIGFAVDTTSGRIVGYYRYGAGYSLTNDDSDAPEYAVVAQPCQRP